jgi:hypothetical protein
MQTHVRDPVTLVGAIEKHQTSQGWNRAERSRRRIYGDDESTRTATAGDDESTRTATAGDSKSTRKSGAIFFLVPYCSLSGNIKRRMENGQQETRTVTLFLSFLLSQQNKLRKKKPTYRGTEPTQMS